MLVGFGLDGRDAIRCAIALTGRANLDQLVPITPAGLGTYHAVCVLVLSALAPSISYDKAVALAIVTHAIGAIAPSVLGVVVLPGIWTRLGEMTPKRCLTVSIPDASDDASPSDSGTSLGVTEEAARKA
jgi:hypothetical protein